MYTKTSDDCVAVVNKIKSLMQGVNMYDVSDKCHNNNLKDGMLGSYSFFDGYNCLYKDDIINFMNLDKVKTATHVATTSTWKVCNTVSLYEHNIYIYIYIFFLLFLLS